MKVLKRITMTEGYHRHAALTQQRVRTGGRFVIEGARALVEHGQHRWVQQHSHERETLLLALRQYRVPVECTRPAGMCDEVRQAETPQQFRRTCDIACARVALRRRRLTRVHNLLQKRAAENVWSLWDENTM